MSYEDYLKLYNEKKGSYMRCLESISSGDVILCSNNYNECSVLFEHLHEVAPGLENVYIYKSRVGMYPFMTTPGMGSHVMTLNYFYGPVYLKAHPLGNCSFIPCDLPGYYTSTSAHRRPNVFMAAVSPMDENGDMFVGMNQTNESDAIADAVREKWKIILEVNPNLGAMNGAAKINIRDVTCLCEVDTPEMTTLPIVCTPTEEQVGRNVAALVEDGSTIQMGIGGLPNAVARQLMDKKDLGLHTEQFTASMADLIKAGVITGRKKTLHPGKHVGVFADGTLELYRLLREDRNCVMMPGKYVCDPFVIARNEKMVSINTCIEIDLTGQVCSESIGPMQYSGSGGQFCFAYGAFRSKGGKGIIALTSRTRKGTPKIKATLTPGAAVTTLRNYVDWVVTEYGAVNLRGCSVMERASLLISIAHPDDRASLWEQAEKLYPAIKEINV